MRSSPTSGIATSAGGRDVDQRRHAVQDRRHRHQHHRSGITLNNPGTIQAASGTLGIQGTFSNFSSTTNTLTGGTYVVSATLQFTNANIVTNAAAITLIGTAAEIIDQQQ